jgi:prepilin-type N-terminal cleavage/methylation domain-containing protein/prepilin-type processing-associated H-X9-DG protein
MSFFNHPSSMRNHKYSGFTLVELLVVIVIIGILIALLLPAVQAAREAGRQTQCRNHLKQLTLGCAAHVEAHGWFPADGWYWNLCGDPDRGFGVQQYGGWIYNILPYIEQQSLHDIGLGDTPARKAMLWSKLGVPTPLSGLFCPSRRPPTAIRSSPSYPSGTPWDNIDRSPSQRMCRDDYALNYGPGNVYRPTTESPDGLVGRRLSPSAALGTLSFSLGTGYCGHGLIRMCDISDGLSNTFCVGEKYLSAESYSISWGDDNCAYGGHDWDIGRWVPIANDPTYGEYFPRQDTPGLDYCRNFGGPHANGFYMSFCDGSVQQVSYTIDIDTYILLGNRHDGRTIDSKKAGL